jgi:single-strand DNA-binding protein
VLPRITLEGRVVAEPELRFGQSGTPICRMRIVAQDRRFDKQANDWVDGDTLWMDVTVFKQLAENCVESITKGDQVVVTGKIKTEEWDDRDTGQKRSKVAMVADTVSASLQFRVLPHAGATHAERAVPAAGAPPASSQYRAPAEQAYSGADDPPF